MKSPFNIIKLLSKKREIDNKENKVIDKEEVVSKTIIVSEDKKELPIVNTVVEESQTIALKTEESVITKTTMVTEDKKELPIVNALVEENKEVAEAPLKTPEVENQAKESEATEEDIEKLRAANSIYLKTAFRKILKYFDKEVTDEVIYGNLDIENNLITTATLVKAAKNCGLIAEVRRINIFDIKTGYALLIKKLSNTVLVVEGNKVYDPKTDITKEFDVKEHIEDYTGYSVFFYEEDLKISSFIQRTGFLFKSIKKFRTIFIEVIVISLLINIFAVIAPFFTMNVYDRVIPNHAMSTLFVLSMGMIIVYVFDFIFKSIRNYANEYISSSIGQEIDQELFEKLANMKAPGISMSNGAKIALFREIQMVREFYFSRFIPILIDVPFLILFFLILLQISPFIFIVPLINGVIIFLMNVFLQIPLQNTHAKMIADEQNRSSFLSEKINNLHTIKVFNAFGKFNTKWNRVIDKTYSVNLKYNSWVNAAANFSVLLMNINYIILIIVGVYEITNNIMTSGALVAVSTIGAKIMTTVVGFSGIIVRYRSIQNVLRHLEKIMNHSMEDDGDNYNKKGPIKGEVEFRNVTFFYPSLKHSILNKCSFKIEAGEKVGIIGRTGAGKSTITKLLLGLDFPNDGQILVDGIDMNDIHIRELRSNIGYLPQSSQFFAGTIKENILLSSLDVSDEAYKKACDISGVNLIMERTGKGDDMLIAENGSNISGGQQQIIGLARAIINNPPILIFDEPTNGMDTTLEGAFVKNIKEYTKDKTLILITHKASQLSLVDRVILIEQGRVLVDDRKDKVLATLMRS